MTQADVRAHRRTVGLCVWCGVQAEPTRALCAPCKERARAYSRAYQIRQQTGRFEACSRCGAAVAAKGSRSGFCQPCASILSGKRRAAIGEIPQIRTRSAIGFINVGPDFFEEVEGFLCGSESLEFLAEQADDDHRQREPITSEWSDDCAPDQRVSS